MPGCGCEIQGRSASWEVAFQEQRALGWSGRVQRAAFIHVHMAPCRCRAQGPAFSLNGVIPEQVSNCSSVIT